jgi:hypothetical protein
MGLGMNFEQKGTFGLNHTKEITITIPIFYLFIYLFQKKSILKVLELCLT